MVGTPNALSRPSGELRASQIQINIFKQQRKQRSTFPRQDVPESCVSLAPSEIKRAQGRPGAGRTHGPPAIKKAGGSHHRLGRTSGLPCATVLTVSFVLSLGTGLSCSHRPRASQARELDTSVGVSGPHDFAVRADDARRAPSSRPSHPALHVRDDASAPPGERGTARYNHIILKNGS
jgi:hypothetical protein